MNYLKLPEGQSDTNVNNQDDDQDNDLTSEDSSEVAS